MTFKQRFPNVIARIFICIGAAVWAIINLLMLLFAVIAVVHFSNQYKKSPELLKYETIYNYDIYKIKTDIDEEWVVGKTHAEIAERYGNGDRIEILDLGEGYVIYLFFKYGDNDYLKSTDTDICTGTYRSIVS